MKHTTIHILHAQHKGATEALCGCTNIPPHRQYEPQHAREAATLAASPKYPNIQICNTCYQTAVRAA